jgi:hypothetical protein
MRRILSLDEFIDRRLPDAVGHLVVERQQSSQPLRRNRRKSRRQGGVVAVRQMVADRGREQQRQLAQRVDP